MSVDLAQLAISVDSQGFVRADSAMNKFNRTASHTEKQAQKISKQFDGIRRMAGLLTAALSVRAIQRYSDEWTDLNSRILNATKSQDAANQVMDSISKTARRTYSSLSQTAEAYLNNTMTLTELGYSTQKQIELSDSLNNALVVSSTKGERAASVMNALSKALAFGELRGENFNTVIQSGGRVVEALAAGIGVTTLELSKMAEQGLLKTGVVVDALTSQMEILRSEADAMPATIGDAFTLMNNTLLETIGRMNDVSGASSAVAEAIISVSDAIDDADIQLFLNAVTLAAAVIGSRLVGSLYASAAGFVAKNVAMAKSTAQSVADAKATAASTAAELQFMRATQASLSAQLASARSGAQKVIIRQQLAVHTAALTATTLRYNQALVASSAAGRIATASMTAARGAMALLGGPAGILIIAAGSLAYFATRTSEAHERLKELREAAAAARQPIEDMGNAVRELESDKLREQIAKQEKFLGQIKVLLETTNWDGNSRGFKKVSADIELVTKDIETLNARLSALNGPPNKAIENVSKALDKMVESGLFIGEISEEAKKLGDSFAKTEAALKREIALYGNKSRAVEAAYDLEYGALKELDPLLKQRILDYQKTLDELDRINDAVTEYERLSSLSSGLDGLLGGDLFAFSDAVKEIETAVQGMTMADSFAAIADGVGQMKNAMKDGSKEAKALGIVLQGLAVAQGVLAVLNQGQGDPYTAFARMAAMAAAVASLGVQVGNMSSGGADQTASNRQAAQGTGTVFGDTAAKSESILKSTEITASATSELVGINRSMLDAMNRLQSGIAGAVGGILRGGGLGIDVKTGKTNLLGDTLFTELEGLWGKSGLKDLFRNTRKLVDSGISILGGAFGDILSGSVDFAVAFAEIEKKKKIFGITVSESTREQTQALTDETNRAFGQIITAMSDAVFSAAEALGFGEEEIRRRIAEYELAATQISLKDLDAEEQQEQLNAVFSSIFDGLAAEVVPFVKEFSQIGEGYAETLIRIATQVQVATEASKQLGFAIESGLSPYQIAQFADALIEAGGGIEQFISKMQAFVGAFATDEHKFTVASDAINSALSQMGLEIPASREALFALMSTLTDPAQISGLLDLTGAFAEYFDQLDKGAKAAEDAAAAAEAAARATLDALTQTSNAALTALRKSVDAEKDRLTAEYGLAVDAVNAEFDAKIAKAEKDYSARASNLSRVLDRTRESMASLLSLSQALRAASHANVIETDQLNRARRQSAQGVIAGALATGNLSGVESALQTLSAPSESLFGTFEEFALDAALTANQLANLADRTETQADAQERTVMRLEAMAVSAAEQHKQLLATLDIQRAEQLAAMEAGYNSQIAALDQIVIDAEQMLNYLRNIDTTEYSILESLDRFSDAVINEANQRQAMSNDEMNQSLSTISDEITAMKDQLTDIANKTLKELEIQTNEMMREAS